MFENIKAHIFGALKSWTMWFNSVVAAVAMFLPDVLATFPQLKEYLPANVYGYGMAALIVGNLLLRFKTKLPLSAK